MKKAVILLSGGLDSSTCLAYAHAAQYSCYALSFDYGQKQRAELKAAQRIATDFSVQQHHVMPLALQQWGGSALNDEALDVPSHQEGTDVPITYVPARNTIMLAMALGWSEVIDADVIFIGVSSVDYSGYPDCRPEYIQAFETMANRATKRALNGHPIQICTPLMHLSKSETIHLGLTLGVDYTKTVSCYRADDEGLACGECSSCYYRKNGFLEAGVADLTRYKVS